MSDSDQYKPHPMNAPGPFFVEDQMCISCGMPEFVAPDLITEAQDGHCYFKKQPTTPEELERAIEAVEVSCCGAVMYGGRDPDVRRRIASGKPSG